MQQASLTFIYTANINNLNPDSKQAKQTYQTLTLKQAEQAFLTLTLIKPSEHL